VDDTSLPDGDELLVKIRQTYAACETYRDVVVAKFRSLCMCDGTGHHEETHTRLCTTFAKPGRMRIDLWPELLVDQDHADDPAVSLVTRNGEAWRALPAIKSFEGFTNDVLRTHGLELLSTLVF